MSDYEEVKYAGFWLRTLAAIADTIWLGIVIGILAFLFAGPQVPVAGSPAPPPAGGGFFLNFVFPAIVCLGFWMWKGATPGKMIVSAKIVDANTGNHPSLGQFIVRYIGYFPAMLVLGLGIIWVAFEPRKRGWHDMMAGTMVIRE